MSLAVAQWSTLGVIIIMNLAALIFGFIKLSNFQNNIAKQTRKNEEQLNAHERGLLPHRDCATHAAKMTFICDSVGRIESQLKTLDQRIYERWINGNKKTLRVE